MNTFNRSHSDDNGVGSVLDYWERSSLFSLLAPRLSTLDVGERIIDLWEICFVGDFLIFGRVV